ncbi:hypothetical protein EVA_06746 [gut metagenome]|uniref:Uncharacterized protein n=1 Tax=gut metagenome TaxID=749906 RepID=J9CY23_9ZZZZ
MFSAKGDRPSAPRHGCSQSLGRGSLNRNQPSVVVQRSSEAAARTPRFVDNAPLTTPGYVAP